MRTEIGGIYAHVSGTRTTKTMVMTVMTRTSFYSDGSTSTHFLKCGSICQDLQPFTEVVDGHVVVKRRQIKTGDDGLSFLGVAYDVVIEQVKEL